MIRKCVFRRREEGGVERKRERERMKVTSMSCGSSHTVVVMDGRELYSWGQGEDGQLEHGDAEERHRPCKVRAC